ncbi:MAG: phosphoglycerate dehydrogenase [Blastocatellia bacterium]|nr:phosphoglycerate dehydrogenase [Blastocatellia bacterium]
MRVLVTDNLDPIGAEVLRKEESIEVDVINDISADALLETIGAYDGLIVRSRSKVTAAVIEAGTNLKVIGRAGTGVDNIDVAAATRRGIVVMNAAAGNTVTTAEHAIALMMAMARNIPIASSTTKSGLWEKKKFTGVEVCHKTLGIVGMGKIGSVVASRAIGLGMQVVCYDPYLTAEQAAKAGVERATLDDLFARSDFITVHTPLTSETKGIIGRDAFSKMKKGVRIVNCARGGLVDEAALYDAIIEGKVAGAALDVYEKEPVAADHPLLSLDAVIATPHLGASTGEAQAGVAVLIAEEMAEYLVRGTIRGAVNFPAIGPEQLEQIRPYLSLGEKLGSFLGQAFGYDLNEIEIEFGGDVAEYDVRPIADAVLTGMLTPVIERINFVNASVIAAERGIRVRQTTDRHARDYASTVTVRTKAENVEHEAVGAVFGSRDVRLVRVDGFTIEAIPDGHLVLTRSRDVPGVIGRIATSLGDSGINIGRFYLGRQQEGHEALALIQVDGPVDDAQIAQIAALPNILSARRIEL